jgi:superfamily I DNA/RNA helicase
MATLDLNSEQLKAVEHAGGPLLVLAGPGTGKTGVLVARIAHLVGERGVSPERVLALTFSRRAADEMRARVTARVPEAEKVEVRTFHSFALSVVRRHAGSLGLRSAPEIVPTNEQWALVSDVLGSEDPEAWGLPPGAFERPATVREVYDLMLRAQEHLLEPNRLRELGERTGRPYLVQAGSVLERYRDRLGRRRASLQPPRSTSSEIAKPRGLAVFVHRRLHIVLQNVRVIDPSFPDDITRVGPNEAVIVCMFPVTLGSTPTC